MNGYVSKKDFGKDETNVGYALYVRNNLKPNDYFRCNTGDIYKSMNVSPIKGNQIYYANGDYSWVNVLAVRNFSNKKADLLEEGDYIRIISSAYFEPVYYSYGELVIRDDIPVKNYSNDFIAEILTKEHIKQMSFKDK